jgi:hypothetical protein
MDCSLTMIFFVLNSRVDLVLLYMNILHKIFRYQVELVVRLVS